MPVRMQSRPRLGWSSSSRHRTDFQDRLRPGSPGRFSLRRA